GIDIYVDGTIYRSFVIVELTINPNSIKAVENVNISTLASGNYYARVYTTEGNFDTPMFDFTGGGGGGPIIDIGNIPVNFGSVNVNESFQWVVNIHNYGDADLNVSVDVSGLSAPFSIVSANSFTVLPNGYYDIQVDFFPS
ncbi:unnamed protein product, partial [marine sediment metagenome]